MVPVEKVKEMPSVKLVHAEIDAGGAGVEDFDEFEFIGIE